MHASRLGRLSSLPNGAKRGLDRVTCPELRLRGGGAHGRTALSYLQCTIILIGMYVVVSVATTWVKFKLSTSKSFMK